MTLGPGGGGHAAVAFSIPYTDHPVPTLTFLKPVYTDVSTFVLPGVVTIILIYIIRITTAEVQVQSQLLCAKVRAGDGGNAVSIAVTPF